MAEVLGVLSQILQGTAGDLQYAGSHPLDEQGDRFVANRRLLILAGHLAVNSLEFGRDEDAFLQEPAVLADLVVDEDVAFEFGTVGDYAVIVVVDLVVLTLALLYGFHQLVQVRLQGLFEPLGLLETHPNTL